MSTYFIGLTALLIGTLAQAQVSTDEVQRHLENNRRAMEQIAPGGVVDMDQIRRQQKSNAASAIGAGQLEGANKSLGETSRTDFLSAIGKKPAQPETSKNGDLIIFVSMSMPDTMLKGYAQQAKRFGATMVLRGMVNDRMSQTQEKIQKLNAGGAAWQINPEAFTKFRVEKVPSIVVASAESSSVMEDGCSPPGTYALVAGDVGVAAALDRISLYAKPVVSSLAKTIIAADRKAGAQGPISR